MSRATAALLATVDALDPDGAADNDDVRDMLSAADRRAGALDLDRAAANDEATSDPAHPAAGVVATDLTTWIDALALTLAAGLRAGATGLHRDAERAVPTTRADDERPAPDADVLTVDEVAVLLQLGRNAVYEAVSRNEIPHRRIGKQIRFSRRAVVSWLDSWSLPGAKEGT